MAWNVVIAGAASPGRPRPGGSSGCCRSSRRGLVLVNDVNFLLYTPFLPEAAAGTLEPRHVVTPLRDILKRTNLRLGAITGHDPASRTVELHTHEGGRSERATTSSCSPWARSRAAAGSGARPARDRLQEPGRRDLAAKPRGRDARACQRHRRSGAPRRAAHLRLRRRRLRRPRGARRAPGLRRRRDGSATRELACTGCAGSWSRPLTGCCPRSIPSSPTTRCASCAGAGSTSASAPAWRRSRHDSLSLSTGETIPTRTVVWTAGVAPHPSLKRLSVPLDDERPRPSTITLRVAGCTRSGRSATAPRSRPRPVARLHARRPPSTRSARARSPPTTSPPSWASAAAARSPTRPAPRSSTSAATRPSATSGRRPFSGFVAWWLARTYHMSQIPGLARKVRAVVDWTVGLPFRRDISEVGSIGHPRPLRERGLRARRLPPPAGLGDGRRYV